jgi:diguanylate cyclase (GGDEF)-like protein
MRASRTLADVPIALAENRVAGLTAAAVLSGLLIAGWWISPVVAAGFGLALLVGGGWWIIGLRRRVRQLTDRDALTGTASRAYFLDALTRAIQTSRHSEMPVSVAVLDCDDFKRINEQFGHAVGDAVLIEVAGVLVQVIAKAGTVARIWGDAFGILLPGLPLEPACDLLESAQRQLKERMAARKLSVTFSTGVSCKAGKIENAEVLLADADALMFEVKRRGRDGVASRHFGDPLPIGLRQGDVRIDIDPTPEICPPSPQFVRQA